MVTWKAVVTLDNVDIASNLFGSIEVECEESVARIASFTMYLQSGAINPGDWLGKPVTINYQTLNSTGVVLTDDRIFTGTVDVALYDPVLSRVDFECTDSLRS